MMMQLDFPLTLVVLTLSSLPFLLILFKYLKSTESEGDLNRIPGPRRLPLIGNLHLVVSKSPPHHIFRDLAAKYGDLIRLQLGEVPFLIVSSAEVAEQVMKTHDVVFANRPLHLVATPFTYGCTDIGMSPYGEYWRQLRKICTLEVLSARRVKSFRPIREDENANVFRTINNATNEVGSPANVSETIFLSSFDITRRASVGKEEEHEKQALITTIKVLMKLGSGFSVADFYPSIRLLPYITGLTFKINRLFRLTDRILERIIKQHKATPVSQRSEDLADVLLKYQNDETQSLRLTTDNIKAVILDMFLAGGETSATVVEWAMSEMIRNPNTLKKAQDEVRRVLDDKGYVDEDKFNDLKYLKLVVKETLRLHPPLPLLVPRQNSEKCEINGYEIPAKSRVIINAWAIGRDPKYWNEAEKFKPERFEDSSIDFKGNNFKYIPFGAGKRMCPGMSFGLANLEFSLAMLLYHFDWEMPNGMKNEELDMTEAFGASVKRKHELVLIPTLKRPLLAADHA